MSDHACVTTPDRLDFLDLASQLTAEDVAVRDSVARFVDDRCCRSSARLRAAPLSSEPIPQLAALGVFGAQLRLRLRAWCGGLRAHRPELERGDSAIRSFYSCRARCDPIHQYGSEAQRQRWLPAMRAARSRLRADRIQRVDPANLRTQARRNGGDWLLIKM